MTRGEKKHLEFVAGKARFFGRYRALQRYPSAPVSAGESQPTAGRRSLAFAMPHSLPASRATSPTSSQPNTPMSGRRASRRSGLTTPGGSPSARRRSHGLRTPTARSAGRHSLVGTPTAEGRRLSSNGSRTRPGTALLVECTKQHVAPEPLIGVKRPGEKPNMSTVELKYVAQAHAFNSTAPLRLHFLTVALLNPCCRRANTNINNKITAATAWARSWQQHWQPPYSTRA